MRFANRQQAGQKLAQKLVKYQNQKNLIIYALPRGGVVLGAIVAKELKAPLDLIIPRKIGHQFSPEYALCAVCENGSLVCNQQDLAEADPNWFAQEKQKQILEAKRRREKYLANQKKINPRNKIAIIIDDGVATGLTMLVAIKELKTKKAKKIIVAVPVLPQDTAKIIKQQVDELIALRIDKNFLGAIAAYYQEFKQVEDKQVIELIQSIN